MVYGLAIVLLGGLVAYLTARSVTERLGKLAAVADRFRLGGHDLRIVDASPDEVGAVARGVNASHKSGHSGGRPTLRLVISN